MNKLKTITAVLLAGLGIMSSCKKETVPCTITADRTAISGVAAQNPAAEAIVITTDAAYWIVTTPSWISADPVTAVGGGNSVCTLTIGNNYKDANTDVAARSGEVKFSGGGTSLVITVSQEGYTAPVDPSASIGGIPSKEEFTKFVAAVNSGKSIDRWLNKSGEVELLSDLDLSSVTPWVAIGTPDALKSENNACSYEGNAFKGKFNGSNHTISGVNITADLAASTTTGFFGVLDGATVKDLKLKGSMTLSAAGTADAGFLAGTVKGASISNVTVEATVKSTGATGNTRFAIGGIAGYIFGDATSATSISLCSTTVTVEAVSGGNTANGATCCMFGGIAGFSSTDKTEGVRNTISDCTCNGEMTVALGRCSGICASCNYATYIKDCKNNANQVNTFANGRIANITCILGGGQSGLENCVNNGNITTSDAATTTAAMVGLLNSDDCVIKGGANYGTIIGANTKYLGLIAANCSKFASISDFTVGGKLGVYSADGNHQMYEITSDNFQNYIGTVSDANRAKISGLVFGGTPAPVATPGIASAADLKEFADLVNAGGDYSKFVSDGAVVLKADIDLAGAEWTPIGKGSATTAAVITEGDKPFTGVFDGKGYTIDNFKVNVAADAVSGYSAGLFGILSGATVKNVIIGSKAVLSGKSALESYIGSVAGFAINSTIENCENKASLDITGVTDNKKGCLGGIAGEIYTTDVEGNASYVKGCTNSGVVSSTNTVNTKNGATGLSVAGIVGFADAKNRYNYVQNCTNKAAISAQATRLAGIVASANTYTKIEDCTNEGKISDSDVKASNSRVGGICSAGSTEVYLTRCINRGDVVFSVAGDTTHGYAAGIFGQANNPVVIDGCENYGSVLSDMYKGGVSGVVYMGIILGNANNKAATVKNCKVGGKIGPVSEDDTYKLVTIDASNFDANITLATSKAGSLVKESNSFAN